MIGHDGGEFVLFGMLTQIEEGKLYLEDDDAHIELDISKIVRKQQIQISNKKTQSIIRNMNMAYLQMVYLYWRKASMGKTMSFMLPKSVYRPQKHVT